MTASSSSSSLHLFVQRVSAARRLNFADLRRLQRDVLPNGPQSRADVEALILLDASLDRFEAGWTAYLLGAVQAFVEAHPGAGTAWLGTVLERAKPKTATAIARAVPAAAEQPGAGAFAKAATKRRPKMAACATGLRSSKVSARLPEPAPTPPTISFTWPNVRLGGTVLIARMGESPAE